MPNPVRLGFSFVKYLYKNKIMYYIHKQLIPIDINQNDPNWAKRQIWVLRLNAEDTIDTFDTLDEAKIKRDELDNNDPTSRIYRVVIKNDNGKWYCHDDKDINEISDDTIVSSSAYCLIYRKKKN